MCELELHHDIHPCWSYVGVSLGLTLFYALSKLLWILLSVFVAVG